MNPFAILGLAGAGMGAFGQYQSGRAQNDMARYNAALLEQRALATEMAMRSETELMTERARGLKASQQVAFAKSGAAITSGTPLLVMVEQAADMERDILEQRRTRTIEAMQLRQGAAMKRYEGRMAKRAGTVGAFTTLLGGVANIGLAGGFSGGGGGGTALDVVGGSSGYESMFPGAF